MKNWFFAVLLLLVSKSPATYGQCLTSVNAGPNIYICNNNIAVNLHATGFSASGLLDFQWHGNGGTFSSDVSQNTIYTLSILEVLAGTRVIVTATDPVSGCSISDSVSIVFGVCQNPGLITGTVFYDLDSNGVQDPGENGIPYRIVEYQYNAVYTDATGHYELPMRNGTFPISVVLNQHWLASTPSPVSVTINNDTLTNYNFGIYLPNVSDVRVVGFPSRPRPGFPTYCDLSYNNEGSTIANGTIEFKYDSNLVYVSSIPAHTTHDAATRTITYTYSNLQPQQYQNFRLAFTLPVTVPLGTIITSSTYITLAGDARTNNNYDTLRQVTVGSYDPNDKAVKPAGMQEEHYIRSTDELQYTIRFQNTGTAEAINVVIIDTLENTLDSYSLEMIAASHSYRLEMVDNRIVKWIFENIMLPDSNANEPGSHGFVCFKILQKSGNTEDTEIKNTAGIYFDFNAPVITNTTWNTVNDSFFARIASNQKISMEENISIYPNPNSGYLYIDGKSKILNYQIISATRSEQLQGNYMGGINTSMLSKGVYVLKVTTETGTEHTRLVIY